MTDTISDHETTTYDERQIDPGWMPGDNAFWAREWQARLAARRN